MQTNYPTGKNFQSQQAGGLTSLFGLRSTTVLKPVKVLLVDDDPVFLKISHRFFEQKNMSLVTCSSIKELMNIDLSGIDVALLDFDLGVSSPADGSEIATYIAERGFQTRVVVISNKERKIRKAAGQSSCHRFCNKSVGLPGLAEVVYSELNFVVG